MVDKNKDMEDFFRKLAEMGDDEVRRGRASKRFGAQDAWAEHWLNDQEAARAANDAERKERLEQRRVVAAEESAEQAKRSANAAEVSASIANRALVLSLIALAVAIGSAVVQCTKAAP
jgi:hypothetical protein